MIFQRKNSGSRRNSRDRNSKIVLFFIIPVGKESPGPGINMYMYHFGMAYYSTSRTLLQGMYYLLPTKGAIY